MEPMKEMQPSRHGLFLPEHATTDPPPRPAAGSRSIVFEYPPTAEDWEIIKVRVHALYVVRKQPLKDVKKSLDRVGFRATDRMIKSRLRSWGFVKNAKKEDWGLLAVLHQRRKREGHSISHFAIHGHRKTIRDLHRFVRNQSKTLDEFVAEYTPHWETRETPSHIRAWTPEPNELVDDENVPDSPLSIVESPALIQSPPATKSTPTAGVVAADSMTHHHPAFNPYPIYNRPLSPEPHFYQHPNYLPGRDAVHQPTPMTLTKLNINTNMSSMVPTQIPTPPLLDPEPCYHMEAELRACGTQLLEPQPLTSKIGRNDMQFWSWLSTRHQGADQSPEDMDDVQICTRCRQPSFQHFRSLDNFEPLPDSPSRNLLNDCHDETWHLPVSTSDEGVWLWVSRCFFACMCFSRGDEKMGHAALSDAAAHFERLLQRQDRLLLTGAMLMMTILHMHNQSEIALKVVASAKAVADRVFPDINHPIRTTMTYFMHSANDSFRDSNITSDTLHDAYRRLRTMLRDDHPYVIAARCNYSWMLKYEDKLEAAERNAREVYKASCAVFTDHHMQSVIALCLVAGCLYPQAHRRDECIRLYQEVIDKTEGILGVSHPYRLEAKRRQADRLRNVPNSQEHVLRLNKQVLWGRAKMLGRKHSYTLGARRVYEDDLRKIGRWEVRGEPSREQLELVDLFSRDFAEAWISIGADGEGLVSPGTSMSLNQEAGRLRFHDSRSRTPSPATSDDYAAY